MYFTQLYSLQRYCLPGGCSQHASQNIKQSAMEITKETRIIDLTVGQLLDLLTMTTGNEKPVESQPSQPKRLVYGIAGIAQLFNCSMTTANRIKASGKIKEAITQQGRIIIVDADKALALFNQ